MRRWWPALCAQALGWLIARLLLEPLGTAVPWPVTANALVAGLWAALLSLLLREPKWRAPMHLAFCLAVGLAQQLSLPPLVWAGALAVSLLVFGGGLTGRRAPLYLTQERALAAILDCVPEDSSGACLDVGAGVGSFILRIAPLRPGLAFAGIERSPLVCLLADLRCRWAGLGRVRFGDLWQSSLAGYQVVYAFLSPEAMEGLWQKACVEMEAGTLLVVNAFPIPGVQASRSSRYGEGASEVVYAYRLPERGAAERSRAGASARRLPSKRSPSAR